MYRSPLNSASPTKRLLTVHGHGIISIEPTICEIHLGVVTEHIDLKQAQQQNAQKHHQLIQALLQLGIPQQNIQTIDYSIYPQYEYVDNKQVAKGFQVTHMLSITIENFENTGIVIDTAIQNGANRVSNISFTTKNHSHFYKQALQNAIQDASSKAQTIAQTWQISLDPIPFRINELSQEQPPIPYTKLSSTEMIAGASTSIEPGQLRIEAKIEAKFTY